jgi:hypothetical protein
MPPCHGLLERCAPRRIVATLKIVCPANLVILSAVSSLEDKWSFTFVGVLATLELLGCKKSTGNTKDDREDREGGANDDRRAPCRWVVAGRAHNLHCGSRGIVSG